MKPRPIWYVIFLLFNVSMKVAAQATAICPPAVLLDFARSSSACFRLERNQACYGNGTVSATYQDEAATGAFTKAGDIERLDQMRVISLTPSEDEIAIVSLAVQASLKDTEASSVMFLAFGNVTLENKVNYLAEVAATAKGTLTIRRTPDINGDILFQLAVNKGVIANGRTADQKWLRVIIPDSQTYGWVATELVSTKQSIDVLSVVDVSTPVLNPFQVVNVKTADAGLCEGKVAGGLLIQTPNIEEAVSIIINAVEVRLAGTAYLTTLDPGLLTINILDGKAEISNQDTMRFIPAGARLNIPVDSAGAAKDVPATAEPYSAATFEGLPLNNLPKRVKLAEALTPEQITTLTTEYQNQPVVVITQSTPEPNRACRYLTLGTSTLWAGPGDFYEAINEIAANARVYPVLQIKDADGATWWQLNNSNWIKAKAVQQLGDCVEIPITDIVPVQPYNIITMETCKTQNGPLRAGQTVTIEFKPAPFENYYDASIALQVDPGQISIDERFQRVTASRPISIGTAGTDQERYVRIFSTTWKATGGTHKIISERLAYILSCNITVPFG